MLEPVVSQLTKKDAQDAIKLIEKVVRTTFEADGLTSIKYRAMIDADLSKQKKRLKNSLRENADTHFLIAKEANEVIGTIGYSPIGREVSEGLHRLKKEITINNIVEVISLYVAPQKQRSGIGTLLFEGLMELVKQKHIEYFSACSGYPKGIAFWQKKLGTENIVLKKYYSGHDCYVWLKMVDIISVVV